MREGELVVRIGRPELSVGEVLEVRADLARVGWTMQTAEPAFATLVRLGDLRPASESEISAARGAFYGGD